MQTTAIQNGITPSQSLKLERAQNAAKEFEGLFASMMLRAMRKTVDSDNENSFVPTSTGTQIYTEMLDNEYAKKMSNNGSLGLADMILKQLAQQDGELAPLLKLSSFDVSSALMRYGLTGAKMATTSDTQALPDIKSIADKYADFINEASTQYGVDRKLIAAVITQESNGNPFAVSKAGAKGLMQLMDGTAGDMGVTRPFDARANIMGGTKYLRLMLDRFDGDVTMALASYNAGPEAVEKYNGVPPYKETRQYVGRVQLLRDTLHATPRVLSVAE